MSNISQLENFISSYKAYDEVMYKASQIDKFWRSASIERALRNSKKIKADYKGVEQKSPVIGYIPINDVKTPDLSLKSPRLSKFSGINQALDEDLMNILHNTDSLWENLGKVKEINKALKSKSDTYKSAVIQKYEL